MKTDQRKNIVLISVLLCTLLTACRQEERQVPESCPSSTTEKPALPQLRVTADSDESVREDRFTGGHIEQAAVRQGDPAITLTINIPAFRLTLWQSGREVRSYQIGVGRRRYPLPTGERQALELIFNPRWIPPDSDWVRQSKDVEPYEKIEPGDPRNPLGRIKIPLGDAYLIHEAESPADIGALVSHGCARMLTDDLFDLAEKIIAARNLPVTQAELSEARVGTQRRAVKFDKPLPVDLNYDTQVIEGGVLRLYPDVYRRGTNTVEKLRDELQRSGLLMPPPDDQTLRQMLKRVNQREAFVVKISDLAAGRALSAGCNEPLTDAGQEQQSRR